MISLYILMLASVTDCDPNLTKIMWDKTNEIMTEFSVAENEHGQCIPNGSWKETWHSGQTRLKAQFEYGIECGRWTYYYVDGQKRMTGLYCCDKESNLCTYGEQFGLWRSWHTNGHVAQEGYYCGNGLQCGRWRQWWSNGNLRSDASWQNGKLSGRIINYFTNGIVAAHGWNETDKKIGKWTWYDNEGNTLIEKDFDKK